VDLCRQLVADWSSKFPDVTKDEQGSILWNSILSEKVFEQTFYLRISDTTVFKIYSSNRLNSWLWWH
jgi:hypothetical protein